jgi:Stress responsive A/B Barrel Domain
MVVHVVLYRPRADATQAQLVGLADAISAVTKTVGQVRRCWLGRTLPNPPRYKLSGFPDFPFCAVLEFDDAAGLEAYLAHETHAEVSRLFNQTTDAALIYDYETVEVAALGAWFDDRLPP